MYKREDRSPLLKNFLLGVAFILALLFVLNTTLKIATRHGKEKVVPDFTNMTFEEAQAVAQVAGVRVVVSDSVYIRKLRKGAVYNQTPKAGGKVKEGRRIMLTTNSRAPKPVAMPSLVGLSLSQAKTEIESRGLILGHLSYVNDIATNIVIKQQVRGREIRPGQKVGGGSTVNLVLGLSQTDANTYVPKLIGRKLKASQDMIHDNSLNVGKVSFDRSVKTYNDTVNAVVFKQNPSSGGDPVTKGTDVSISLTVDKDKIK